jgi:sulfate adenylyltransferase (ADP) / ATP adenylyltransferase
VDEPRHQSYPLAPGTLWRRIEEGTAHALAMGALQTIPTRSEHIEDGGLRFVVRIAPSLERKDRARRKQAQGAGGQVNPFLPYERDLFVADISDTHFCLLNKFNVVERHLLIVTRAFEDQECLLNTEDFAAIWTCMLEFDGLGFYNGGSIAGASQRHKHLQMVPLPLAQGEAVLPIEPVLADARYDGEVGMSPALPFRHAAARIDMGSRCLADAAARLAALYRALLGAVGLHVVAAPECDRQSAPYNLLMTREWMLLVPRSAEFFHGISVNALGYAGALLVRSDAQMTLLRESGPMAVLRQVGLPA